MGENPSSPEDGLEDALRRALSDAVNGVEPGGAGLDDIRARIGSRPPRPWLLSVLSGAAERVRFWTWRGHWAWSGLAHARARLSWRSRRPRHRKGAPSGEARRRGDPVPQRVALGRRAGLIWLASALAAITVFACVSSVQPFRQAIISASTVFNGGSDSPTGGGADGTGAQTTTDGSGVATGNDATGTARPGQPGATAPATGPGGVPSGPTSADTCQPSASGNQEQPGPTAAGAAPTDSGTTSPTAAPTLGPADTATATPDTTGAGTATATATATPSTATATPDPGTSGTVTPSAGAASASTAGAATAGAGTTGATTTPDQTATAGFSCVVTPRPGASTPAATLGSVSATAAPTSTTAPAPAGTPASTGQASAQPASAATADPSTSPTPTTQDQSPTTLIVTDSWRWEARLRDWHHWRHAGRR